jgi:hypothetical protein
MWCDTWSLTLWEEYKLGMFGWHGLDWPRTASSGSLSVKKTLASVKGHEFVGQPSNYQLLKKNPTSSRAIRYQSKKCDYSD